MNVFRRAERNWEHAMDWLAVRLPYPRATIVALLIALIFFGFGVHAVSESNHHRTHDNHVLIVALQRQQRVTQIIGDRAIYNGCIQRNQLRAQFRKLLTDLHASKHGLSVFDIDLKPERCTPVAIPPAP